MSNSSEIESPCVKICVVDPHSGHCIGCGRSRDEIAGWLAMSAKARKDVMDLLPERVTNMTRCRPRRGGADSRRRNAR